MKTPQSSSEQEPLAVESFCLEVGPEHQGERMDRALVSLLPEYTRGAIQSWLKGGHILLDGRSVKPSEKVRGRPCLSISIPASRPEEWQAQNLGLDPIFEDEDLIVIDKPAGLVVHPGAGNPDGTLLNGLLHLEPALRALPRAGIVHRLDKDTTGLMVVARSERARQSLIDQLKSRTMSRRYLAVVFGVPISGETIDQPIGRHRSDRLRMAVTDRGKPATTHVRVIEKYMHHALIEARLESGRTHQIRVHLSWRGFPLVGDPVYGGKPRLPRGAYAELLEALSGFRRQALHACHLALEHPETGEPMAWHSELPEDICELISALTARR